MKVKELIEILKSMHEDIDIVIRNADTEWFLFLKEVNTKIIKDKLYCVLEAKYSDMINMDE